MHEHMGFLGLGIVGCGFMYRCKGGHVEGRSVVMGDVKDGRAHEIFC